MEIQQSPLYIQYVSELGWKNETVDQVKIIYKHFPFYGGLAKIQRPTKLPDPKKVIQFIKTHKIRSIAVEPDKSVPQRTFTLWLNKLKAHVKLNTNPYLPTKTIRVDLSPNEDKIFSYFSEAKRRAVRRALKNKVLIKQSLNIDDLIKIKNKSGGLFGFITTYGIKKLWPLFAPKNATILLAYASPNQASHFSLLTSHLTGGVLLLFLDGVAYYWIAGATKQGKKLFAPTLLVWETLKLAKKRGNKEFDFVGVVDERLPGNFKDWKGFTKFKEGFGGEPVYYPIVR